jgi:hypothetical protein
VSNRDKTVHVERKGRSVLISRGLPEKLERQVKGDFVEFARRTRNLPAPPFVPPPLHR